MIDECVREKIVELLKRVERDKGIEILYACESGSRAWGFESPDSDYDIRFIYARPESAYLEVTQSRDTIEIPIHDDLDAGGWDVRKALSLLRKSNGPLVEWLHSPVVYYEKEAFLDRWRGVLKEVFAAGALADHYRGLAYQMWKGQLQDEMVKAKSYLYCLRAVLSAEWVVKYDKPAPVPFSDLLGLLSSEVRNTVDALLEAKAQRGEKEKMEHVQLLDDYLSSVLDSPLPAGLSRPPKQAPSLDKLFQRELTRAADVEKIADLTLKRVKEHDLLLFQSIAGSRAYGTNHAGSDTDYRGVFAAPQRVLFGLEEQLQVQDERGDDVYYELEKFIGMLVKNNPNMMELLYMPSDCVLHRHPVFDLIKPEVFLSKKCELSFANYAVGQVKKARGLNKKIVNPEPEQRKSLVDFCYVLEGQGSVLLTDWLDERGIASRDVGIVSAQHAPNLYSMYHDDGVQYRGIFSPKAQDEIICSSVEIEAKPIGWMSCNYDAYKKHCKSHREYWDWVKHRNVDRYQTSNDVGYDAKNMMHTLRLLDVAEEIASEGLIRVRRPNREFLMQVREGKMEYEELLVLAEEKMSLVREAYAKSSLPDEPDYDMANELLQEMRAQLR